MLGWFDTQIGKFAKEERKKGRINELKAREERKRRHDKTVRSSPDETD